MGRQEHNSKWEIFKTDEIETANYSEIVNKCEVLKFEAFIKKVLTLKEKKINFIEKNENTFFVRQKYSISDDSVVPDLTNTCYCDQIFNPDRNFIQCKKCKELIHMECFLAGENKRCFNGSCNNNIENQLQEGVKKNQEENTNMIGSKRKRENEVVDEEERKSQKILPKNIEYGNKTGNLAPKTSISADVSSSQHEEKAEDKAAAEAFPNLSESGRKYLKNLIDKIEKKNNAINKPLSSDEKSRRTIRVKIFNSMLYGIEEVKESGEWSKMKVPELNREDITEEAAIRVSNNLAVAIESAVFFQNNEIINNNYKKKFRTLYSNLSDFRNHELRCGILNNDILPEELVKMQAEELAPTSLRNRRIERQNKYFKEQVLMKEETKIIAKTHKGESILTVDKDPIINPSDFYANSTDILSINKQSVSNIAEGRSLIPEKVAESNNNNQSDKGSWSGSDNEDKLQSQSKINKISKKTSMTNKNTAASNTSHTAQPSGPPEKSKNKTSLKYKNLSPDQLTFYNLLEEYKKESLLHKFDDKLRSNLKQSTYNEIIKLRGDS